MNFLFEFFFLFNYQLEKKETFFYRSLKNFMTIALTTVFYSKCHSSRVKLLISFISNSKRYWLTQSSSNLNQFFKKYFNSVHDQNATDHNISCAVLCGKKKNNSVKKLTKNYLQKCHQSPALRARFSYCHQLITQYYALNLTAVPVCW